MGKKAFNRFLAKYAAKHPNASECLKTDCEALPTCYDIFADINSRRTGISQRPTEDVEPPSVINRLREVATE